MVESSNILTKADILQGKNRREKVFLEYYNKNVVIRPLTDGELTDLFKQMGNVRVNPDGTIDLSSVDVSTNLKMLRQIVSMALVEPEMSESEIAEMRFGVPGIIARHVLEISGLGPGGAEATKKFRSES
jgi:hypothetical protein